MGSATLTIHANTQMLYVCVCVCVCMYSAAISEESENQDNQLINKNKITKVMRRLILLFEELVFLLLR